MPYATRTYDRAVINVRVRTREDVGDECGVCLSAFCAEDVCNKSSVQTTCCMQGICAACVHKLADRCACTDDCKQVVYTCPFCRTMSRTTALDVFLGMRKTCKSCRESTVAIPDGLTTAEPSRDARSPTS